MLAPEGRDASPLGSADLDLVRWAVAHAGEQQSALLRKQATQHRSPPTSAATATPKF